MEMTGLDPDSDKVLEIAIIVTDKNLQVLDATAALQAFASISDLTTAGPALTDLAAFDGLKAAL